MSHQNRSDEPVVEDKNTAEMPSDDMEIRDQPRETEEAADNGEWTEEELDAYNTTGEVREPFFDLRDDDPIEVSEGDTEPPRDPNNW